MGQQSANSEREELEEEILRESRLENPDLDLVPYFSFSCNSCKDRSREAFGWAEDARKHAISMKWKLVDGHWICPSCQEISV